MLKYQIVAILSFAGQGLSNISDAVPAVKGQKAIDPYVVTRNSNAEVEITRPMYLDKGVYWQGKHEFTKSHILWPETGKGSKCESYKYKDKDMKTCVQVDSNAFKFGSKYIIADSVTCKEPPCFVPVDEKVGVNFSYQMDYSGVEGDKGRYYFIYSNTFLPEFASPNSQVLNSSLPFIIKEKVGLEEGKGLWFRPLIWKSRMTMITTVFSKSPGQHDKQYISTSNMTYPYFLPYTKFLDGVYGLEQI